VVLLYKPHNYSAGIHPGRPATVRAGTGGRRLFSRGRGQEATKHKGRTKKIFNHGNLPTAGRDTENHQRIETRMWETESKDCGQPNKPAGKQEG